MQSSVPDAVPPNEYEQAFDFSETQRAAEMRGPLCDSNTESTRWGKDGLLSHARGVNQTCQLPHESGAERDGNKDNGATFNVENL